MGKAAVLQAHLPPTVPLACQMENAVHLRNQGQGPLLNDYVQNQWPCQSVPV